MIIAVISLKEIEIGEQQLVNLATEFFGTVVFPAGNHQECEVHFEPQPELGFSEHELRAKLILALAGFRRKQH